MNSILNDVADLLGAEYEVLDVLGQGYLATVIRVRQRRAGIAMVAKVFDKDRIGPESALYLHHLAKLETAIPQGVPHLLMPRGSGENDKYFFQLFDFLPGVRDLAQFARDPGLSMADKFRVIAHVGNALAALHHLNIIHGDVKPANVLVIGESGVNSVWLSDFGMVQQQADDAVLLFGTYAYLHPALLSGLAQAPSNIHRVWCAAAAVGPYIDIYACGILSLELLTGGRSYPSVVSPETIGEHLKQSGLTLPPEAAVAAANLIARMLSVGPNAPPFSAREIHERATALALAVNEWQPSIQDVVEVESESASPVDSIDLVHRLEEISIQIEEASRPLLAVAGELRLLETSTAEAELLKDLEEFFATALHRTRVAWRFAAMITATVFTIVVTMIVLAITLTVVTGESRWALIFGGVGVPALFAVFIWKPYDRIFRAAMLSQMIELIHMEAVTGVRSTKIADERQRIFHQATERMRTLLQDQIALEVSAFSSGRRNSGAPKRKATPIRKSGV